MCKCTSLEHHKHASKYTEPSAGDVVVRFGEHDPRAGLLYHVDAYDGGLPRAHVVYNDGTESHDCLFLFQSPEWAMVDPCWY
jgi:hypothetical protein